jgi:hypothetical protein
MLRQFFDSTALIKYYHDEIGSPKVQILVGGSGSEHYVARLHFLMRQVTDPDRVRDQVSPAQ